MKNPARLCQHTHRAAHRRAVCHISNRRLDLMHPKGPQRREASVRYWLFPMEDFAKIIERAMASAHNSGNNVTGRFTGSRKTPSEGVGQPLWTTPSLVSPRTS